VIILFRRVLGFLVCRGLSIVGKVAVFMTFFIIAPFVVMGAIAIPRIEPRNWLVCDLKAVKWGPFINVMFWYVSPPPLSILPREDHQPSNSCA